MTLKRNTILKRKILLLLPLAVIASFIIYTWCVIMSGNIIATWRHYIGLVLLIVVIYILARSFTTGVVATGVYLIIGLLNLLTITPDVITAFFIRIGSLEIHTPLFQPKLFLIFLLYFFLNFDTLVDIQLDYKEAKELKKKQ